jgi:hypothetical protein
LSALVQKWLFFKVFLDEPAQKRDRFAAFGGSRVVAR